MTILIVEDNPTVRRLIRRAISDIADTVVECEDGADSLEAYIAHRPNIVLMDVRMPRMDGLTATRKLLREYPAAKVIILTDYNDDELRSAAREAGACAYALKHNLTELEDVILQAYSRPSCSSESESGD
jgi:two-component system response regulator DegU